MKNAVKANYRKKKTLKRTLIAVAVFLVVGLSVLVLSLKANGVDVSGFGTVRYQKSTYTFDDVFGNIYIDTSGADIAFVNAEDGEAKVVCYEPVKRPHSVCVSGGTLSIKETDLRKWNDYVNVFTFATPKITVYIPNTDYATVSIKSGVGDIDIPKGYSFEKVNIQGTKGDVTITDVSAGSFFISLTGGDVNVKSLICLGELNVDVSSGNLDIEDVTCKRFETNGKSGDVVLEKLVASETVFIERTKGDLELEKFDANEINIKTSSGDVKGAFLSPKKFITETSSGDVNVPYSPSAVGVCQITTKSGDIEICYS